MSFLPQGMSVLQVKYLNSLVASIVQVFRKAVRCEVRIEDGELVRLQSRQFSGLALHQLNRELPDITGVLLSGFLRTQHGNLIVAVDDAADKAEDAFVPGGVVTQRPSACEVQAPHIYFMLVRWARSLLRSPLRLGKSFSTDRPEREGPPDVDGIKIDKESIQRKIEQIKNRTVKEREAKLASESPDLMLNYRINRLPAEVLKFRRETNSENIFAYEDAAFESKPTYTPFHSGSCR